MPWFKSAQTFGLDKIICGDNVKVMCDWPAACVDLVVTSPPYDNLRKYGGHTWDFEGVARELTRVLKPGGVIVWVVADATVNGSETLTSMRQAIHFKDVCGLNVESMIWEKTGSGALGSQTYYGQNWEFMFVLSKGQPAVTNLLHDRENVVKAGKVKVNGAIGSNGKAKTERVVERKPYGKRSNIWRIRPQQKSEHPAPFPEELARDHITSWSNPGDVVLDPFCGSGTTCVAARELGRYYVGVEVNPDYVALINRRLNSNGTLGADEQ
jgi:DNA modification methylase